MIGGVGIGPVSGAAFQPRGRPPREDEPRRRHFSAFVEGASGPDGDETVRGGPALTPPLEILFGQEDAALARLPNPFLTGQALARLDASAHMSATPVYHRIDRAI